MREVLLAGTLLLAATAASCTEERVSAPAQESHEIHFATFSAALSAREMLELGGAHVSPIRFNGEHWHFSSLTGHGTVSHSDDLLQPDQALSTSCETMGSSSQGLTHCAAYSEAQAERNAMIAGGEYTVGPIYFDDIASRWVFSWAEYPEG